MSRAPRPSGWRVLGWLLTPFVVWAASFVGGWIGAIVGKTLPALVIGAVAGGIVGGAIWVLVGGARRGPRAEPSDDAGRGPSGH